MDEQQKKTYDAIVARCRDLIPSVDITKHIKRGTLRGIIAQAGLTVTEFIALL